MPVSEQDVVDVFDSLDGDEYVHNQVILKRLEQKGHDPVESSKALQDAIKSGVFEIDSLGGIRKL